MEILADPITVNCRKVLAGLKLIGADYTLTKVDYFKGEQKNPEYMGDQSERCAPGAARRRHGSLGIERDPAVRRRQGGQRERLSDRPEDQGRREPLAPVGMRRLVLELLCLSGRELRQAASGCSDGPVGARRRGGELAQAWPASSMRAWARAPACVAITRPSPTWPWRRQCTSMAGRSCRSRTTPTSRGGCRSRSRRRPGGKRPMWARDSRCPSRTESRGAPIPPRKVFDDGQRASGLELLGR